MVEYVNLNDSQGKSSWTSLDHEYRISVLPGRLKLTTSMKIIVAVNLRTGIINLKSGEFRILKATDEASRGLH